MEWNEFISHGMRMMEQVQTEAHWLTTGSDAAFCIIETDTSHLFAGVTSVKFSNGVLKKACAEYNAVMAMCEANETAVVKMVTLTFRENRIQMPCEECLKLLIRFNIDNTATEVNLGNGRIVSVRSLLQKPSAVTEEEDTFSLMEEAAAEELTQAELAGSFEMESAETQPDAAAEQTADAPEIDQIEAQFGFAAAESKPMFGADVEFVDHVTNDTDNPFYEPPIDTTQAEAQDIPAFMRDPHMTQPKFMHNTPTDAPQQMPGYVQQPQAPGYLNAPNVGYIQQPQQAPGYVNTPNGGYVQQPQAPGYVNTPNGGYIQQPQASGYINTPNGGYVQPQASGYLGAAPAGSVGYSSVSQSVVSQPMEYYEKRAASQPLSQPFSGSEVKNSVFSRKLSSFLSEEPSRVPPSASRPLSRSEMMKQAKERKKNAKIDAEFKKRMKKMGF